MERYRFRIETDTSIEKELSEIILKTDNSADVCGHYNPDNAPPITKSFGVEDIVSVCPVMLEITVNTLVIIDYIKRYIETKRSSGAISEKTKIKIHFKDSSAEKTLDIETCDIEQLKASLETYNDL